MPGYCPFGPRPTAGRPMPWEAPTFTVMDSPREGRGWAERRLPTQGFPCSAVHWPAVVRVRERGVSPLCPASRCSARRRLPSRGSLGPHFPTFAGTMRRYDCHPAHLGVLHLSLVPRYLACFRRSWCPLRARGQEEAPGHARAFDRPVPLSGSVVKETGGSPTFPSSPSGPMPRSQTPVVSCALAIARPGLLPSGACTPSAFPSNLRDILLSTTLHLSGLNHAACVLATPGFVRPLTGRHAGSLLTGWLGVSQGGLEP